MDGDFARVSGGGLKEWGTKLGALYSNYWMVITVIIVLLVILFLASFLGYVSISAKNSANANTVKLLTQAESFACNPGNQSAMCRQTRESLTSSAIATGFEADPSSFCAAAGTDSTDPWSYLSETAADATTAENLSRYATATDRMEHALAVASQH